MLKSLDRLLMAAGMEARLSPQPNQTVPAKLAKLAFCFCLQEYLKASTYFYKIGAQTHSSNYGGSRSLTYYQMINGCTTLKEIQAARNNYRGRHAHNDSSGDESGAFLRIAAYRLSGVFVVGKWLEAKVRADDITMAGATFSYPEDHVRYIHETPDSQEGDQPQIVPD